MKKFTDLFLPIFLAFGLWVAGNVFFASAPARGDELISVFKVCVQQWKNEYTPGFCEAQAYSHCTLATSPLFVIKNSKCQISLSILNKCNDKNPDYNVTQVEYAGQCVPTAGGACTVDHVNNTIAWQQKNSTAVTGYTCAGTDGGGDTSLPKYCPTCP